MSPTGRYGSWIRRHSLFHIEMRSVFVHACVPPKAIQKSSSTGSGCDYEKSWSSAMNDGTVFDAVWHRPNDYNFFPDMKTSLQLLDADRMIVGHTVVPKPFVSKDEDFVMMDVGLSRWMDCGAPHVVELTEGSVAVGGPDVVHSSTKNGIQMTVRSVPVDLKKPPR